MLYLTSPGCHVIGRESVFIVIMPEYLFETNGFRINQVNVIKEKYSITDNLGSLPVMSQASFPAFCLGKSGERGSPFIFSVYAWELNITTKHPLLL